MANKIKLFDDFSEITITEVLYNTDFIGNHKLINSLLKLTMEDGIRNIWLKPTEKPCDVVIAYRKKEVIGVLVYYNNEYKISMKEKYKNQGIESMLKKKIKVQ